VKVLIFSDIHGDTRALEQLIAQPADIYIAAGDLSTFGKDLDRCGEIMKPLGEKVWVLPGNHESHDDTRAFCQRFGFFDFHRQIRALKSERGTTQWAGLGYSNITPFNTPGEYTEEEIAKALAPFDNLKPLYLVVHFPPQGTRLDEFAAGKHAGSPTLREWVDRVQPLYLFCGHIHECAGRSDRLGSTQAFNVGKRGYTVEV
jgi:Icc-related predicted phosphoesterase